MARWAKPLPRLYRCGTRRRRRGPARDSQYVRRGGQGSAPTDAGTALACRARHVAFLAAGHPRAATTAPIRRNVISRGGAQRDRAGSPSMTTFRVSAPMWTAPPAPSGSASSFPWTIHDLCWPRPLRPGQPRARQSLPARTSPEFQRLLKHAGAKMVAGPPAAGASDRVPDVLLWLRCLFRDVHRPVSFHAKQERSPGIFGSASYRPARMAE